MACDRHADPTADGPDNREGISRKRNCREGCTNRRRLSDAVERMATWKTNRELSSTTF
jgi:hypothetical protein